uniref:Pentatricopeptide repeat-containing protein At3g29230 n=1 Tax=Anthurium amnicola TaxID=1678845 RepID=A0A1D1Y4J7_9ARAE
MPTAIRPPQWTSHRRRLEQALADLRKCSDLGRVKQVHAQVFKLDLHRDPFVAPKLVSAYSLCRHMAAAVDAFNLVPEPNTHLCNTLIRAHADNSQQAHAFAAFFDMQRSGVLPDNFTYPFLLRACCSGQAALAQVEMIHAHVVKMGFLGDVFVPNSLLDSYSRCCAGGGIVSAKKLFDAMPHRDVVSWNTMITALVRAGELEQARKLFDVMPERDTVSWNAVLGGYAKAGEAEEAFELFKRMPERNVVSWSTVISACCKKGDMDMARLLFDKMPVKNLVPWTIMISAYAERGLAKEASVLFEQMEEAGLKADGPAILSILSACAESGLLGLGEKIQAYITRVKMRCSTQVCNALLDMYAKCGDLNRAWRIFDNMAKRDLVSWNSMVQGLAAHGHGEEALDLFSRMKGEEGIVPDGVTFFGVLGACTHAGRVGEGRRYFSAMEKDYGVIPQIEHYGCMVDLLGRSGKLVEAFRFIKNMPFEPNAIIWGTLLSACRIHNNIGLAEQVVEQLIRLEPSDAGNFAILSNIYAAAGRWDVMAKVRAQMKGIGVQKPSGSSSIEVDDVVHEFTVGDRSHPQSNRILKMLDRLGSHLRIFGYVPKPC